MCLRRKSRASWNCRVRFRPFMTYVDRRRKSTRTQVGTCSTAHTGTHTTETFFPETVSYRLCVSAGKAGLPVIGMFGYVWENNLDLKELHAELGPRFAIDMGVVMGGWNLAVEDPKAVRDVLNSKDDRFYSAWPGTRPQAHVFVCTRARSSVPGCVSCWPSFVVCRTQHRRSTQLA